MDIFIYLISLTVFIITSYLLTKITFDAKNNDPYKQMAAAANFKKWGGWSSGMHKIFDKGLMKDVPIIMLIPLQYILKDKKSFYPIGMLGNIGHFISGILLYLLVKEIFGSEVGLIIYFFYIFSIWPYIMIFHGSVHLIAQMFFLVSIITLFIEINSNTYLELLLFFISGISFALMNFSSASSRKYNSVYFIILIYQLSNNSILPSIFLNDRIYFSETSMIILFSFISIIFILILLTIFRINFIKFYKKEKNKEDIEKINFLLFEIWRLIGYSSVLFFIIFLYIQEIDNIIKLFFMIFGFTIAATYLILPNISENIKLYYFIYIGESNRFNKNSKNLLDFNRDYFLKKFKYKQFRSHIELYENYFIKFYSKVFKIGSESFLTYFKLYFRIIPFHVIMFIFSFLLISYEVFIFDIFKLEYLFIIFLISFLPIILNKITFGPVALLPFYTTYLTIFIPITIALNILINSYDLIFYYKYYFIFFLFLYFLWNIYYFFTDIYPSKIYIRKIIKTLEERNISEIYTYKNKIMEEPFIDMIKHHCGDSIKIKYINSISELKNGIVFIPPISAKSWYYESNPEGPSGNYENFKNDDKLYNLILTKKIESIAITKLKNLGTSSFWRITTHMPAFRDLKLNEINKDTKYLNYAWLIDIKNL